MKTRKERLTEWLLAGISTLSILSMAGIVIFLLVDGLPFFKDYPLTDFLFGLNWYPTDDPMEFGILPLIVGSLTVMALATVIAVPLGVATAIYLSEVAKPGMRRIVKPFVELLAALPSVVIGFFGMVVVAPFLQDYLGASTGLNLLNAGLMLAFMSVPIICSVAEDAIYSVPRELREASLSLGATKWETLIRVVLPAASSGIGTAVMLGMSRSIGETMVVLMVAGGAAVIPTSLFDSVRPIPASIAAEMAEAPFHSEHYYALFATGIVLIIFTLIFNATAFRIAEKKNSGIGC
ncbi:phosphate ABC transporter permease subunit PstC [uncultured Mailhella sp.]|uniref:phosphate ABC transporter permease subunit PstC n=1 Tax=uncultured Mailhella sp. TaxID=1981031 RepID=UPI0025CD48D2|nr:phosphate ABC transporter permease subunit PstC [uncultured Mailhella sp.]